MARVRPTEDVRPLSEFRANAASFVQQVQETTRPVILTVHERSAAVVLDVEKYETLLDQIEVLRDVKAAGGPLKQGRTVSQAKARDKVLARSRK